MSLDKESSKPSQSFCVSSSTVLMPPCVDTRLPGPISLPIINTNPIEFNLGSIPHPGSQWDPLTKSAQSFIPVKAPISQDILRMEKKEQQQEELEFIRQKQKKAIQLQVSSATREHKASVLKECRRVIKHDQKRQKIKFEK
ncbi:hypothetical protein ADUPG1_014334 [Aduncisulcus paluster]|uniref:ALMS motif domain-containing protein n=1 Tax=Aduncisulcus paluster TaxID=2918883 RepID=A0ABQ5KG22_9EUKA|nr:hypothetical protein ADUPG1_014334 [Aduncisulcus paluster]